MIMRHPARFTIVAAVPLFLAACGAETTAPSQPREGGLAKATVSTDSALRQSIETAAFNVPAAMKAQDGTTTVSNSQVGDQSKPGGAVSDALPADALPEPAMVRAQILLDRTRFSPGIVDGLGGENTRQAIAAFEKANDLPVDGELDADVYQRLAAGDGGSVLTDYTITADDAAGPFIGAVPEDLEAMSKLETVGYANAREAMAEKFHMSEELLAALNPGADFGRAGQTIVVASIGAAGLQGEVARIEVSKAENSVRVFDADGGLLAFYPATIGSSDTPSPSGSHTVRAIAPEPNYTYDPSRVSYGSGKSRVVVPPGPNNPVGSVWIDLSRDTYGIHGTPEPAKIGKTASSGCVRLTNWDAEQLGSAVKRGVVVRFI